ncbi:CRISPR-associated Cmr2 family protein [Nocardiopsis sp. Huas11]|uniref:Cas10/Cmr2 second palm domain-containing protein n=1 Tax=Nocardiopsis sp. Huas11 TaxID=2183912 RepID=UPI000EB2BBD8|nr:type III-B CRISPR-associated protein Cas10/Cmr2 [Nocardiopsis sp. Huas11]RKS07007.1 CRISPR-associated Cmr2 family protein [Nocardiopsis sp. Huas11]
MSERDLVVISLSGVQRFITESRSTLDLRAASRIIARLAAEATDLIAAVPGASLVFPACGTGRPEGQDTSDRALAGEAMPNRVIALLPARTGETVARQVKEHLCHTVWPSWVETVFAPDGDPLPALNWPLVQWVVAPDTGGSYDQQWHRAQEHLAARKNIRDFAQDWAEQEEPCSLSPRWPASPLPPGLRPHEKDVLCAVNWVRRRWHADIEPGSGIASTSAIASAPYRDAALRLWGRDEVVTRTIWSLHTAASGIDTQGVRDHPLPGVRRVKGERAADWLAVNGGRWVYPSTWNAASLAREFELDAADQKVAAKVAAGHAAAKELAEALEKHGVGAPCAYLAVLVQDLDSMGAFLSGEAPDRDGRCITVARDEHTRVSEALGQAAAHQRVLVHGVRGRVVYAGGDDLLALVPAADALAVADRCREDVPATLPTVSSGVLFFHHRSSLRHGLLRAQDALAAAKARKHKHGLGVGFVRHSGSHAQCVLPWQAENSTATKHLSVFVPSAGDRARLSPGLVQDLVECADALNNDKGLPVEVARAEVRRLTLRHTVSLDAVPGTTAPSSAVEGPNEQDERRRFAERAAASLEWMATQSGKRRVDESAARVAVFLRQEVL